MLELCYNDENRRDLRPFDRAYLVGELEASGLSFRRVAQPSGQLVCLLFAPVEGELVTNQSREVRRSIVLVAEGGSPTPDEAEQQRSTLGLLGLVEPRAYSSWRGGLFVSWGFYGDARVARAAGLAPVGTRGLQPANDHAALPSVLARFLRAAEDSHE